MSSPDRDVYSKGEPTQNPFHIKELDKAEFHRLIKTYFTHAEFGCQKAAAGSLILPETDSRMDIAIPVQVFDRGSSAHLEQSVGVQKAVYLLAVASDGALPVIRWGAYQDVSYVRRLLNELDAKNAEVNQFGTELEERSCRDIRPRSSGTAEAAESEIIRPAFRGHQCREGTAGGADGRGCRDSEIVRPAFRCHQCRKGTAGGADGRGQRAPPSTRTGTQGVGRGQA